MNEIELDDLKPLLKYVEVLIDEYPDPISQTELATKSSVTKSAVSKIVDRLKPFCSMKILAFDRKLMLKTDTETFLRLLFLFVSEMDFQRFLGASYTQHFIERLRIHNKLVGIENLEYRKYFDEEDTNLIIKILLSNICSYQIKEELRGRFKSVFKADREDSVLQVFPFIQIFSEIVSNFSLGVFETEEELRNIVLLRDKIQAFIRSIARKTLSEWEVVKRIEDTQKKKTYFDAYMEAVDYFLNSELTKITDRIRKAAEEKGMTFHKSYAKIGELYVPLEMVEIEDRIESGESREKNVKRPSMVASRQ